MVGVDHHGIDIGDGTVVHFSGGTTETSARIHRTCLRVFLVGRTPRGYDYSAFGPERPMPVSEKTHKVIEKLTLFKPYEVVKRALSSIGSNRGGYNPISNNCEHFATEMVTGIPFSIQSTAYRTTTKNPLIRALSIPSGIAAYLYNNKQYKPDKQFHGTAYMSNKGPLIEVYENPYIFPPIWYLANDEWRPIEKINEQDLPQELDEIGSFLRDRDNVIRLHKDLPRHRIR